MPIDKEFNTVIDQIRLLRSRNLKISSLSSAKNHLVDKNYFNLINGFETLLLDDPKSQQKNYTDKSFDDFVRLYDFDIQLSSLLFNKISEFETKLKTSISYHFCKHHCSTLAETKEYIDISNYKIPVTTDGPREYIDFFYNGKHNRKTHKLFKTDYYYHGKFKGRFHGSVTYTKDKTILRGTFKGRFGSTTIKEVEGSCEFYNSNQKVLSRKLKAKRLPSGQPLTSDIIIVGRERIVGLNYIDKCKIEYPYINEYNTPPFWVVIKTLMINDLIILLYGLKKRTFDAILRDFNLKPQDKQKLLNSMEIIRELRNTCAHFELVNRFRTSTRLKIDGGLINELNLNPIKSSYAIKLYDVLKVLKVYVDLSEIKLFVLEFWYKESKNNTIDIAISLLDRMGNADINDWIENL